MVGLFGLGNKGSPSRSPRNPPSLNTPPPPYSQDNPDPSVFATETTTTTTHVVTTTTHTTTHFFSLPLWKRRGSPAYPPPVAPRIAGLSSDELGTIGSLEDQSERSVVLLRNKALPPTPDFSDENERSSSSIALNALHPNGEDGARIPRKKSRPSLVEAGNACSSRNSSVAAMSRSSYTLADSSSQPTVILARAALGLGLHHVTPNSVVVSSSATEVNTVAFGAPSVPGTSQLRTSDPSVRRVKSFQKDTPVPTQEPSPTGGHRERRRTRGLSLGPLHFSSDGKGKDKQREAENDTASPKPLSRKSSFWSRKRFDSRTGTPPVVPSSLQPSLPLVQPVSPFYMDTNMSPSFTPGPSLQSPELQRRHSERTRSYPPSIDIADSGSSDMPPSLPSSLPSRRCRRSQRPQTADSASSPRFFSGASDLPQILQSSPPPLHMSLPALKESSQTQPSHVPLPSQTSRPRAQTNPPLLHRLSVNIFGSSSNSPSSTSAPNIAGESAIGSPPSSLGSSRPSLSKPSVEIPRPRTEDESPEVYLTRLMEAVSKAEVATVLAANSDEFHARALRAYIERFEFTGNPLDVAVRKLLMDVGLPRETQQIDRVIEAFAARYTQCNPNLFTSDDHPYILAFSLIMLHTDAFNKSNKRKMSKLDYVKNTRLPGVAPEVLDCFYDNIVFAPFIFIEDPVDVNGQRGLIPEAISRRMSTLNMSSPGGLNGTGSTLLGKSNRIDPYYLITQNLLDDLRVNVDAFVPPQSPFFYQGTGGPWVEEELLRAFAMARVVEVAAVENRYLTSPWFGLNVTGPPSSMFQNSFGAVPAVSAPGGDMWSIKVTKVGLLLRKDDTLEGGRRAINRKWREWSVLLTGSQLLFFRDSSWAPSIQAQMDPSSGQVILPHTSMSQPDELLSVRDAIAVFDSSYSKYPHAFRLVMPDGRHYLVQAPDEKEMNEWISRINYASAFKTAGVRMRGMGLSGKDIELTGIAAAASHLRDLQHSAQISAAPKIRTWNGRSSEDLDMSSRGEMSPTRECSSVKEASAHSATDDAPTPPFENTSLLFKATFDQVKTELASGRWRSLDETGPWTGRKRAYSWESTLISPPTSPKSDNSEASRLSSRSQIIKSKVHDLESKIALAQTQLDADMRFVRNLAVLTPFQRATRDRMQLAVQGVAKRIMHIRLDLEKLVCYRDVLANDLAAEERDWQRTKTIALRAATEKLESQRAAAEVPRMTLSLYLDESEPAQVSAPLSIPSRSANTSGYSSNGESFHSAQSGSLDWDPARRSSALVVSSPLMFESPMASPTDGGGSVTSTGSFPFPETAEPPQAGSPARERSMETSEGGGHEKFYTAAEMSEEQAEQAEEWNKTRAAKRVSLVKLPSDLRISMLFGKPAQTREEGEGESTVAPPRRRGSLNPYDGPGATVMMLDV